MYERATSIPAPSGILLEADHNWKHTQQTQSPRQRFFGHSYMAPTPSISTTQQIGIGIAHAYSSLLLKATQNLKISHDMPGFDIFNFLLPRDQNKPPQKKYLKKQVMRSGARDLKRCILALLYSLNRWKMKRMQLNHTLHFNRV